MNSDRSHNEAFSSVDAAWLRMDTPTNLAMITGVIVFDTPIDFERLKATFESRLLIYNRFRQRVRETDLPIGGPRWEMDPCFNILNHVHRIALPEPGDHEALQHLVGDLMSTPLDRSKPLWHFHLIEKYGQGSALVGRLHHCIADGLALMQVLFSLTDEDMDAPWPAPVERTRQRRRLLHRIIQPAVSTVRTVQKTWQTTGFLVHEGFEALGHPSRLVELAKTGTINTLTLAKLLLLPPDRNTILRGQCGIQKRAVWSQPILLEDVKAVGHTMGGTVNDVLLSAFTGALRRYLEDQEQPVQGLNIRAIVPVSLRKPDEFDRLGNRFGLVFLSLPIGVRDQLKRLVVIRRRMDAIKNSADAIVAFGILSAMGMSPIQIENIILSIFGMKGTAVMTNVPGPRQTLYMAGGRIRDIIFWVPSPANLGMGVSIMSYDGKVVLGVATDINLVPDPEKIIATFQEEFEFMKRWGRPTDTGQAIEDEDTSEAEIAPNELEAVEQPPTTKAEIARVEALASQDMPLQESISIVGSNGYCQAITKSGKPCKNHALPGTMTCRVHALETPGIA